MLRQRDELLLQAGWTLDRITRQLEAGLPRHDPRLATSRATMRALRGCIVTLERITVSGLRRANARQRKDRAATMMRIAATIRAASPVR